MWKCSNCGCSNNDNSNYCGNCGSRKEAIPAKKKQGLSFQGAVAATVAAIVLVPIIFLIRSGINKEKKDFLASTESTQELATKSGLASNAEETGIESWTNIVAIDGGGDFIAGLRADGTVNVEISDDPYGSYSALDTSSWSNIKKISAGGNTIAGLREDGSVVVTAGYNDEWPNTPLWENIVDISNSGTHVVGVTTDGKLKCMYIYGDQSDRYASWTNVKSAKAVGCDAGTCTLGISKDGTLLNDGCKYKDVSSSGWLTVGIRDDGSIYFWGIDASYLQPELILWKDMKQVCPGDTGAVGLQENGRLVFAGSGYMYSEAASWTDIDRIILLENCFYYDGDYCSFLVGIRKDRTVVTTGTYLVDTEKWNDIIDVVAFENSLVGLREDGSVVTAQWSPTKNEAFLKNCNISYDDIYSSLPLFNNGWLTFANGGDMYVPTNFVGVSAESPEEAQRTTYRFSDRNVNMDMQVSESHIADFPGVEYEYTDNGIRYYVQRNGNKMDVISAVYLDLCETYPDAQYTEKAESYCVFGGVSGDYGYYIRYQVQCDAVYTLCFQYPITQFDTDYSIFDTNNYDIRYSIIVTVELDFLKHERVPWPLDQ